MKNLSILGSTGSIGCNALNIIEKFPEQFSITALAAGKNTTLLAAQIKQFNPELAVVFDETCARALKEQLPVGSRTEVLQGEEGYCVAAACANVDLTLISVVGAAGLKPTLAAIEAGNHIALANKETLVMAGEIVIGRAVEKGIQILPVDSEHSAIFQCLRGHRKHDLDRILLTASGGPFLNRPQEEFADISIDDALQHPNWKMGKKITVDSATLMNKGLEVLEAKHLFDVSQDMIEVVIHPQSIIHSMVAYTDGSILAQLGIPDMKAAIAYALSYPRRLALEQPLPDFSGAEALTFQKPDLAKFPCLALAFDAGEVGGTLPAVLNAANEMSVHAFLAEMIAFNDIPRVIAETMEKHSVCTNPDLDEIFAADRWAREHSEGLISRLRD
jgi:1-deoxy-D-xylulose-5-phosphate reductoisomerase